MIDPDRSPFTGILKHEGSLKMSKSDSEQINQTLTNIDPNLDNAIVTIETKNGNIIYFSKDKWRVVDGEVRSL